jgi:curved DNA-binding protein CbpA
MSAPRPQQYQDHYAVLGVEPKSDSETISKAYQALARRFHANNRDTGDKEKFRAVTEAYETLANPASREAFDNLRTANTVDTRAPEFSGPDFFTSFGGETMRRMAILCVLYDRRRLKPSTPSLTQRQMEAIVEISPEVLSFAVWYLKQRSFVMSDDKSGLLITIAGMEYLEQNLPAYADIERFLKVK